MKTDELKEAKRLLAVCSVVLTLIAFQSCQDIAVNADVLDACSFSPVAGKLQVAADITILNSDPEAVIRYTLDDPTINESSPQYTGAVSITDDTVLRAKAFKSGYQPSPTSTSSYKVVWKVETELPARREACGAVSSGSQLYYIGGFSGMTPSKTVDAYNFTSKGWSVKTDMPTARGYFGIALDSGIVYCLGGWNGSSTLTTVEAFDISTESWTKDTNSGGTLAPMTTAKSDFVTAVFNGKIYCFGGSGAGGYSNTCCVYDIAGNTWSSIASLPYLRVEFRVAEVGAKIYCIGGYNRDTYQWFSNTWAYDPATNLWDQTLANLPTNRQRLDVIALDGHIYCLGGENSTGSGTLLKTNEVYDPSSDSWAIRSSIPFTETGGYSGMNSLVSNGGYIYLLNPVSSNNLEVYRYNPSNDS